MAKILVAADTQAVVDEVQAALDDGDSSFVWVRSGAEVVDAVLAHDCDLAVLDLQIGNMGGMATCMELRHEQGAGRCHPVDIIMLLDREADIFLARRSGADGWLLKPINSVELRRAAAEVLEGGSWTPAAAVETVRPSP